MKFAKLREQQTGRKAAIRLGNPSVWIAYYFRRYIRFGFHLRYIQVPIVMLPTFRLTPVYLVIMILDVTLFTYVSDGPFWRPIETNYCKSSWWVNLLYLNNFIKQDDPVSSNIDKS